MTSTIIVNQNPITGTLDIAYSGPAPKQTQKNATLPMAPYSVRTTTNRTQRPSEKRNPIENQNNEIKQNENVTVATPAKTTPIITKKKPKHTRMQPMTSGKRRSDKQTLHQTCGSNRIVNGIYPFDNFWWARYNVIEDIEKRFPDIFNLPLADIKERTTPSWQKEIQKAANELKNAKEALEKSAKDSSLWPEYIDILQEDYDALQQQFYQLIARHQQSFNQKEDYTKQIRADRRRAKQLMHGTPKEQLSLAKFYELYVEEPIDTPIIDACLEAEEPAIKEQVLQAWRDAQKQAQQQRFADCMRSLYYEK
jgi:hypothetical protein